uniref:Reverse transcriptase n=1 Tax=Timema poppense TaxID=170557 RepID=A0A7R9D9H0_TIMPO|nr:unnamed protein product [Timema poppensis]
MAYNNENVIVEPVTHDNIKRLIAGMKRKKALGPDGTRVEVIQKINEQIAPFMAQFMNKCLAQGRIPNVWKRSEVVILSKGEDKGPKLPKIFERPSLWVLRVPFNFIWDDDSELPTHKLWRLTNVLTNVLPDKGTEKHFLGRSASITRNCVYHETPVPVRRNYHNNLYHETPVLFPPLCPKELPRNTSSCPKELPQQSLPRNTSSCPEELPQQSLPRNTSSCPEELTQQSLPRTTSSSPSTLSEGTTTKHQFFSLHSVRRNYHETPVLLPPLCPKELPRNTSSSPSTVSEGTTTKHQFFSLHSVRRNYHETPVPVRRNYHNNLYHDTPVPVRRNYHNNLYHDTPVLFPPLCPKELTQQSLPRNTSSSPSTLSEGTTTKHQFFSLHSVRRNYHETPVPVELSPPNKCAVLQSPKE